MTQDVIWAIKRNRIHSNRSFKYVYRMNSEIFVTFCRASKTIENDTKLEAIPLELNIVTPLLSICVGVWVGERPKKTFHMDQNMRNVDS